MLQFVNQGAYTQTDQGIQHLFLGAENLLDSRFPTDSEGQL